MASAPRDRDAAMIANGTKLLVLGLVLIVVGLAITIPLEGTPAGIGLAVAGLGCVPFLGGLGLLLSGLVARRARAGKPFA
jgi:hypothetical protein